MVERGTQIAKINFGKPVPKDLVSLQMTPREIEVTRACFDGRLERLSDGVHTLPQDHRLQAKLAVDGGKVDISTINPNSVPNADEMYGKPQPHTRLDQPGQTYICETKDGKVVSMVACVYASY